MGRIKTAKIKRKTREVMSEHNDKVGTTFEENKKLINSSYTVLSKKITKCYCRL